MVIGSHLGGLLLYQCALVLDYAAWIFMLFKNMLILKWTLGYLQSSLNASCTFLRSQSGAPVTCMLNACLTCCGGPVLFI